MPAKIDVPLLRKAVRAGPPARVHRLLDKLEPLDLAPLLGELSPAELRVVVRFLIETCRLADTLDQIPDELLPDVLQNLDDRELATILERLDSDDATHLAHRLEEERRHTVLALVKSERAELIDRLMSYSQDSAGGHMIPSFLAVTPETTVGEAIHHIRQAGGEVPLFYLYVVDRERRLVGVASLSQLVKAGDATTIQDLMVTDLVTVGPDADQEEVARVVSQKHLLAVPVVSPAGKLLGLVTIDDVINVLEQEATEDMYRMAGLSEGDRVFSPPHRSLVKRLPWNMINLFTSMAAAGVVGLFETTIAKLVALATFMPVVAGIGGNTGNQTLTVIIRGIALGELEFSSAAKAIAKELVVGLAIGVIMGCTVGVMAVLWKGNAMLGLVIALAMVANLFVAALAATAIPLTLKRLGLDPALGSTILVTMCTDVFGFLSFLGLATLWMHWLM